MVLYINENFTNVVFIFTPNYQHCFSVNTHRQSLFLKCDVAGVWIFCDAFTHFILFLTLCIISIACILTYRRCGPIQVMSGLVFGLSFELWCWNASWSKINRHGSARTGSDIITKVIDLLLHKVWGQSPINQYTCYNVEKKL